MKHLKRFTYPNYPGGTLPRPINWELWARLNINTINSYFDRATIFNIRYIIAKLGAI